MKTTMIRIGNFFFHWRNKLFPVIIIALYCLARPPLGGWEKDAVAVLIAISGLAVRGIVIGYAYIKRGGMNKRVYAENLVTEGMFSLCRNPLYVGNILIYVGVFLLHGDPLVFLLGMAIFLFIYQCIVLAEEAYLRDKFGPGYEAYCADVPRWIPKLTRFKQATEGMRFNASKALIKDYSTISTTLVTLLLTNIYKYAAATPPQKEIVALLWVGILLVAAFALTMRVMKKRKIIVAS